MYPIKPFDLANPEWLFREMELSKHKDGLERERDRLLNEVNQLNTKLANAMGYQEELEKKNSEADLKMNEISGKLEVSKIIDTKYV